MKYAVCLSIHGMLQIRGFDDVLDAVQAVSAADQRLRMTDSDCEHEGGTVCRSDVPRNCWTTWG